MHSAGQYQLAHTAMRLRRGFTVVELLVVVAIIMVLAGLILAGAMVVRASAMEQETRSTLDRLHIAVGTLLLEKPIPRDPATGNDLSGYLVDRELTTPGGPVRSMLQELQHRQIFGYKPSEDCDAQGRLLDAWQQPYLFVVGEAVDPEGHQPSVVAAAEGRWQVVNAVGDADSRIYLYSYGPDNRTGAATDAWLFHEVD